MQSWEFIYWCSLAIMFIASLALCSDKRPPLVVGINLLSLKVLSLSGLHLIILSKYYLVGIAVDLITMFALFRYHASTKLIIILAVTIFINGASFVLFNIETPFLSEFIYINYSALMKTAILGLLLITFIRGISDGIHYKKSGVDNWRDDDNNSFFPCNTSSNRRLV